MFGKNATWGRTWQMISGQILLFKKKSYSFNRYFVFRKLAIYFTLCFQQPLSNGNQEGANALWLIGNSLGGQK